MSDAPSVHRVGHYILEERIGAGGMGEVYRARDAALGRQAAVKLIPPGGDSQLHDRLLREAHHSARLQHPFIATFFDGGIDAQRAWLAVEYVQGETLRTRLGRGAMPLADVLPLGLALLEALVHAHAAGVLHRDLKPENVMVRSDGHVKLLDFGLARAAEALPDSDTTLQLTGVGIAVGTIGYMPPEQLRGEPVDARADLFAVGAILFECLTGHAAFGGGSAVERITAVLSDERPSLPAHVPPGLSALITRALAKARDARPASAAAFLRELRKVSEFGDTDVVGAGTATLAVADFDNLSTDLADNWIGSGMAESLCADLARVPGLQVVSRERWLRARAASGSADALSVAQTLGMRWLLAGGFQRLGPQLRLTARLADVASGQVAWADKVDSGIEQIFAMQDQLAASVTSALNLDRPTPRAVRPQLSAYECYARGRRLFDRFDKASIEQADDLYKQAITIDPACAPAYSGLAGMFAMRFTFTTDPAVLQTAIDYATRAIEVDPTKGDPRIWRGYAYWRLGRPEDGLEEQHQAMRLDAALHMAPYFASAMLLDLGRAPEALGLAQRSVEITDSFPYSWLVLGLVHFRLDRLDDALYCFDRAARIERAGGPIVGAETAAAETTRWKGDVAGARAFALRALERIENADNMYRDTHRGAALIVLGRSALDEGDAEAATVAFGQAEAHLRGRPRALGGGQLLVQAVAGLARASHSLERLDEAIELFGTRATHNFSWAFLANEIESQIHLAIAASALRHPAAGALAAKAFACATARQREAFEDRSFMR